MVDVMVADEDIIVRFHALDHGLNEFFDSFSPKKKYKIQSSSKQKSNESNLKTHTVLRCWEQILQLIFFSLYLYEILLFLVEFISIVDLKTFWIETVMFAMCVRSRHKYTYAYQICSDRSREKRRRYSRSISRDRLYRGSANGSPDYRDDYDQNYDNDRDNGYRYNRPGDRRGRDRDRDRYHHRSRHSSESSNDSFGQ